jgi:hypothetical protein
VHPNISIEQINKNIIYNPYNPLLPVDNFLNEELSNNGGKHLQLRNENDKVENIKPKKEKQVKQIQIEKIIPELMEYESTWEEYVKHRAEIKKPMTVRAQNIAMVKLLNWKKEGQDVEKIMQDSIMNGWQGLFPVKQQGAKNGRYKTGAQLIMQSCLETFRGTKYDPENFGEGHLYQ